MKNILLISIISFFLSTQTAMGQILKTLVHSGPSHALPDEVYLGNTFAKRNELTATDWNGKELPISSKPDLSSYGYRWIRLCDTGYGADGHIISGAFGVFVKKTELNERLGDHTTVRKKAVLQRSK